MIFREFYNYILQTDYKVNEELPFPVNSASFGKGGVLTKYNEIEKKVYFIQSGIVELKIKGYQTEKIIDFFFENEMFCALTSFLTQTPSDVQITAITNCELDMVLYDDLILAYESSLEANKFARIITEQGYIRKAKREKEFLVETAEERYAKMFATHKNYISEIPVNKIAKYLGIHPESLSRIRKKLTS
ncbi:MAG: cyclic nucleotide-binding domain-containing protein [Bacteroidota bacterium]